MTPRVSVIVPARNAAAGMPSLLAALDNQTLAASERETIVVDDASRDDTAEIAERAGAEVVRRSTRGGSYAARNAGIDVARGVILAFTDSDCAPRPDWLERGVEALDGGPKLVAGRIEVPLEPEPTIAELVHASRYLNQAAYCLAGFAATANLFVRASVFEQVGRFNPNLDSGGDREFCLRAHAAGYAPHYCPEAAVVHRPRRGMAEVAGKAFRTGVGRAQTARHGSGPAAEIDRHQGWLREHLPRPRRGGPSGADRLRAQGYDPSRRELIGLDLGGYLLSSPPLLAGWLYGSLSERVRGRRAARRSPPRR